MSACMCVNIGHETRKGTRWEKEQLQKWNIQLNTKHGSRKEATRSKGCKIGYGNQERDKRKTNSKLRLKMPQ